MDVVGMILKGLKDTGMKVEVHRTAHDDIVYITDFYRCSQFFHAGEMFSCARGMKVSLANPNCFDIMRKVVENCYRIKDCCKCPGVQ